MKAEACASARHLGFGADSDFDRGAAMKAEACASARVHDGEHEGDRLSAAMKAEACASARSPPPTQPDPASPSRNEGGGVRLRSEMLVCEHRLVRMWTRRNEGGGVRLRSVGPQPDMRR